tara:strand:+ start:431 stop:649 length:219 start_codon:yes stop_codon:yes gene_type:complete
MSNSKRMSDQLQAFYLDYFNNYLTVDCIAEHHGMTKEHANELINIGRIIHETRIEAWWSITTTNYCPKELPA